ncbi:hypothetical protein ND856_14055 [Leptospira bandrabouensis]|uniref:hypothetical protein n=1 Tax=Leptospira bandrabouensis TaxID=2484903 RepID=UPI00223E8B48|nr:hypothetical protein [Leptospira bandrabouensis]MCW7459568.1 hypothetical protein [Leptospira bandrabouensis]MCW7478414.1 hypothetical protein [Leptospira bandrabouensis]MCW7486302.1 hypothetical protein [Leptospira bandrabouensis]
MVDFKRRERKQFILDEVNRLYDIGRFHKDVVSVDDKLLDKALDLHFARIDAWHASRWVSQEEKKRADRHKVGANTALAIMEHKPLITVQGVDTNPYETAANGFLAIRLAFSRVFSEHEEKLKLFDFPEREILQILSTLDQGEWTPKTFSLDLYRMEEQYLAKYKKFLSPTGTG